MTESGLAPLQLIHLLRMQLHQGVSTSEALHRITEGTKDPYFSSLRLWRNRISANQKTVEIIKVLPELNSSPGRRALLIILEKGLAGSPIDEALGQLEEELYFLLENIYEKHAQSLPLKLLVPLLFFIMPAVLSLILGPLLMSIDF